MLPDRVSNSGPLTYESGALPRPSFIQIEGWSGGARVLGKLSVSGRPTTLDYSRARAYCACSRCGWGFVWTCFSRLSFLSSVSLSLGDGPL